MREEMVMSLNSVHLGPKPNPLVSMNAVLPAHAAGSEQPILNCPSEMARLRK